MINLFFRITNRLFAFFMDYLGRALRSSHQLVHSNTINKRLLVVRQGGLGDLLFISSAIAGLKRRHPELSIDLMCHPRYQQAFHETVEISHLIDHRWPSALKLREYDYFIFLDGIVETDNAAKTENVYDLFATKYFGLTLAATEKKPARLATDSERRHLLSTVPKLASASLRIGLQLKANSPVRTPEPEVWARVISAISETVPNITLFIIAERGNQLEVEAFTKIVSTTNPISVIDTSNYTTEVKSLIALVSMMEIIVAPDSSVTHIAAAFDIPTLGIYGPFPADLRTRYYPHTVAIDAPSPCAPCFTHGHWPCPKAIEEGKINSPCFSRITSETLKEALIKVTSQAQSRVKQLRVNTQLTFAGHKGSCRVCGHVTDPSGHTNFAYCQVCGCYSNTQDDDRYPNDFWHLYGDETINSDRKHWERVCARLAPLLINGKARNIIDLAGGLGLFSAQVQNLLRIPCTLVDACEIPDAYITHDKTLGLDIIKQDVFEFLASPSSKSSTENLVICTHFVEHLEISSVVQFLGLLSSCFHGSIVCLYMPSAEMAFDNEADFLHFNTHYPGEHRIIWNHAAFTSLLRTHGMDIIDSDLHDSDSWYVFRL